MAGSWRRFNQSDLTLHVSNWGDFISFILIDINGTSLKYVWRDGNVAEKLCAFEDYLFSGWGKVTLNISKILCNFDILLKYIELFSQRCTFQMRTWMT